MIRIRLNDIERKLDLMLEKLSDANGIRGFGTNLLANLVGDYISSKR
ncbi:hypothetical protein H6A66_10965 [Bacteroides caecigallinarum]|nr:hypothetical protein [Bacteroides caecigallinarum]MBM6865683.1 hypothetical protein [Bacteroides caecigallinarum]